MGTGVEAPIAYLASLWKNEPYSLPSVDSRQQFAITHNVLHQPDSIGAVSILLGLLKKRLK